MLIIFMQPVFRISCKDSANRMQNKMNPFIFMLRCSLSSHFQQRYNKTDEY